MLGTFSRMKNIINRFENEFTNNFFNLKSSQKYDKELLYPIG